MTNIGKFAYMVPPPPVRPHYTHLHRPGAPDSLGELTVLLVLYMRCCCRQLQRLFPGSLILLCCLPPNSRGIQNRQSPNSLPRPPPVRGRVYGQPPLQRPGGSRSETEGLQPHHQCHKGGHSLPARLGEGLRQPEKGVGRGWRLGEGQRYLGISNQHSPCYPLPVFQTMIRAPLHPGDTHHPLPHIGK